PRRDAGRVTAEAHAAVLGKLQLRGYHPWTPGVRREDDMWRWLRRLGDRMRPDRVERVTGDAVELRSSGYGRSGSNDSTRSGTRIMELVDRDGRRHPISGRAAGEVAPGITLSNDRGGVSLRILR